MKAVILAGGLGSRISEETYVLSRHTPHTVILQNDRLLVRRLVRTDRAGLELWDSMLDIALPATGTALLPVWAALGTSMGHASESQYSLADLLRHVILAHPDLRAVTVLKSRIQLVRAHCHVECVRLIVRNRWWESLAVEDEDPVSVLQVVRRAGFAHLPNLNYPKMLKEVLGLCHGTPLGDWKTV